MSPCRPPLPLFKDLYVDIKYFKQSKVHQRKSRHQRWNEGWRVMLKGKSAPLQGPAPLLSPLTVSLLPALPPGSTWLSFQLFQTGLIQDIQKGITDSSPWGQAVLLSALELPGGLEYFPHGLFKDGRWDGKGCPSPCPRAGTSRQRGWGHLAEAAWKQGPQALLHPGQVSARL